MPAYFHVYTGDGKGKTTAALGLALRAAGAGWNVFIGQFAKGQAASEIDALRRFDDRITIRQFGRETLIAPRPDGEDVDLAETGLAECAAAISSGRYRLVILDEANAAAAMRLLNLQKLLEVIDSRPEGVELVLTGRWAPAEILDRADLVTEMREIKHYYRQGVPARVGIEA
jgi:cob(I)alamin adenosyltransferase